MLPRWFKEYLSFHKSERRGFYILCAVLIALIAFNLYQRLFWKSEWEEVKLEFGPAIVEFTEHQDSISEEKESPQPWIPAPIKHFKFDPNTLDSSGWVSLGFSPKQSAAIIRYRNAGAVFRKPEDVKKLFVVDDKKYKALKPFISIKPLSDNPKSERSYGKFDSEKKEKNEPIVVELNLADTAQLKRLFGIGSSYAKRIVKYRELLGGYVSKEQVLEVYGMDTARYLPIVENLTVDPSIRNRININTADFKTLLRHPYLNKNQVKAIVNYRKHHGHFNSVTELQKVHLLKGEPYRKIAPYFTVQ